MRSQQWSTSSPPASKMIAPIGERVVTWAASNACCRVCSSGGGRTSTGLGTAQLRSLQSEELFPAGHGQDYLVLAVGDADGVGDGLPDWCRRQTAGAAQDKGRGPLGPRQGKHVVCPDPPSAPGRRRPETRAIQGRNSGHCSPGCFGALRRRAGSCLAATARRPRSRGGSWWIHRHPSRRCPPTSCR